MTVTAIVDHPDGDSVVLGSQIAGEDAALHLLRVSGAGDYALCDADVSIFRGAGHYLGFYCVSTAGGKITVRDGVDATGNDLFGELTPVAGTWYAPPHPIRVNSGLYMDFNLAGGALTLLVLYQGV